MDNSQGLKRVLFSVSVVALCDACAGGVRFRHGLLSDGREFRAKRPAAGGEAPTSDRSPWAAADGSRGLLLDGKVRTEVVVPFRGLRQRVFDAWALKEGQVLDEIVEHPFRRTDDGGLTNGFVVVPPRRPSGGAAWLVHGALAFAKTVSAENWGVMLQALEGCWLEEVQEPERLRSRLADHRRREAVKRACADRVGACFDPTSGFDLAEDPVVSALGERWVFRGFCGGRETFVVDGPHKGVGLYVFDRRDDAFAWARGEISFPEARLRSRAFVPHVDGWEERAKQALAA